MLSELASEYLNSLKILSSSELFLITDNGEIIFSDDNQLTGKMFKDVLSVDFLGKEKVIDIISSELAKDDETKIKMALPNFDKAFNMEPYLISASPVRLNNNLWKVIVSSTESDLLVFTYNIFNKQVIVIFVVVTLFILLTLRASRDSGYNEAVEDEHRKHNIKLH